MSDLKPRPNASFYDGYINQESTICQSGFDLAGLCGGDESILLFAISIYYKLQQHSRHFESFHTMR